MENQLSLLDYLGKPAGTELGKQVYKYACSLNQSHLVKNRKVNTKKYTGNILTYPKDLLDSYFNNVQNNDTLLSKIKC
jgi:hypothetical protein